MQKMQEINLLKNELRDKTPFSFGKGGLKSLYVVLLIVAFELLVFGAMVFWVSYLERGIQKAEAGAAGVDLSIKNTEKDRLQAVSFQRRLSNLEVLLVNHVFWSEVLDELAEHTYKGATYETFQVNEAENKLTLSGNIPSYTEMGKLMLGLKQSENIRSVNLLSTSQSSSGLAGYSFNLEIVFDPKLLKK